MTFTKMHGLGNDYIYVDLFNNKFNYTDEELSIISRKLSDRHFGIGADGLIIIEKSEIADFKMRIFNSDGGEAKMCGNGLRCVGRYVYDNNLIKKTDINIETLSGIRKVRLLLKDNKVESVIGDIGEPVFDLMKIPALCTSNDDKRVHIKIEGNNYILTPISMGNPHAVTIAKSVDDIDVNKVGEIIKNDFHFPEKTNVEFVEYIDPNNIKIRVYERGSKETYACGTGASAAVVYTFLNGLTEREVRVNLKGGTLDVNYNRKDNHVYIKGPVEEVFKGELDNKKILKLINNSR